MKLSEKLNRITVMIDRSEERLARQITTQARAQQQSQAEMTAQAAPLTKTDSQSGVSQIMMQRLGAIEALLSSSHNEIVKLSTQQVALRNAVAAMQDKAGSTHDMVTQIRREGTVSTSDEPSLPVNALQKAKVTHEVGLQTDLRNGLGNGAGGQFYEEDLEFDAADIGDAAHFAANLDSDAPARESRVSVADDDIFDMGMGGSPAHKEGQVMNEGDAYQAIELYNMGCKKEHEKRVKKKKQSEKKDAVARMGRSTLWKIVSTAMVLLNVALVGSETEMNLNTVITQQLCIEGLGPAPDNTFGSQVLFLAMEWAFLIWMFFELGVNVWTSGGLCSGDEKWWNIFDAVVLAASAAQLAVSQLNMSVLRVVRFGRLMKFMRLIRLAKVMKVLRLFRFLHGVRKMVLSMIGSLVSLFWALFLMFFVVFLLSVVMLQGIEIHYSGLVLEQDVETNYPMCAVDAPANASYYNSTGAGQDELPIFIVDHADPLVAQVNKLYGGIGPTMMTLFGAISGGSEWAVVAHPVHRISPVFTVIWMVFICVMIFGVLNILTGIFVDAAMQAAQNDRDTIIQQEMQEQESVTNVLRKAFMECDTDGSGQLTEAEFSELLEDQEVLALLSHLGLHAQEASGLFKLLDDDKSGSVGINEFINGCIRLKGGAKEVDIITLMYQNKRLAKAICALQESIDSVDSKVQLQSQRLSRRGSAASLGRVASVSSTDGVEITAAV